MAKSKNLTQDQLNEFVTQSYALGETARDVESAISKQRVDDNIKSLEAAGALVAVAKFINSAASALLSQHDIQETRRKIAEYQTDAKKVGPQ